MSIRTNVTEKQRLFIQRIVFFHSHTLNLLFINKNEYLYAQFQTQPISMALLTFHINCTEWIISTVLSSVDSCISKFMKKIWTVWRFLICYGAACLPWSHTDHANFQSPHEWVLSLCFPFRPNSILLIWSNYYENYFLRQT